jgi:hypothetical protein
MEDGKQSIQPRFLETEGSTVRALLGYFAFAGTTTGAQNTRAAFADFVTATPDTRPAAYRKLGLLLAALPSECPPDEFKSWNSDRRRYIGEVLLHLIIPWYRPSRKLAKSPGGTLRYKSKRHKWASLVLIALDALMEGKEIPEDEWKNVQLAYYWHDETMLWLGLVDKMQKMTDEEFCTLQGSTGTILEQMQDEFESWDDNGEDRTLDEIASMMNAVMTDETTAQT